jgi:drug/metabolite transporter (DMT)-like permease
MPVIISLGAIAVMLLWSLCFPLINVGLSSSPPLFFVAIRALLAGMVLLLFAIALQRPIPRDPSVWIAIVIVGLTATTLGFFGMVFGGGLISPGIATVISNTQPLIAAVLAYFWLNESLTLRQKTGLVIGFFGILLISFGGNAAHSTATHTIGIIYILMGAVGIALSNVTLKWLAGRGDVWMLMGFQLVIGSIPLFVLSYIFESSQNVDWNFQFILVLLTLALLGTAVATVLWFTLLNHVELSRVNVFTFLTPVFGLLIGLLFFDESLGKLKILGTTFGIFSVYLVSFQGYKLGDILRGNTKHSLSGKKNRSPND